MIDAYHIESRTSVYPRVVISPKLIDFLGDLAIPLFINRGDDGLNYFDYFSDLLVCAPPPKQAWLDNSVSIINRRLDELRSSAKLNEFAKWSWFQGKWLAALRATSPETLRILSVSVDAAIEGLGRQA
jgi:hypothetical protein